LKSFLSHGGYAPRDASDSDIVAGFPKGTLIVVTFDESAKRSRDNRIYTVLYGDMVCAHSISRRPYNHYNVLSTIEQNFGLAPLAEGDGAARPIDDVWSDAASGCAVPESLARESQNLILRDRRPVLGLLLAEGRNQVLTGYGSREGFGCGRVPSAAAIGPRQRASSTA
jgi:hypothetical protein